MQLKTVDSVGGESGFFSLNVKNLARRRHNEVYNSYCPTVVRTADSRKLVS